MAIAFVSASSNTTGSSSASSITVTAPASIVAGNLLVAIVYSYTGNTLYLTAPSGWTQESPSPAGAAPSGWYAVFSQYATASDPANYTFSYTGISVSVSLAAAVLQYSGVAASDAFYGTNYTAYTSQTTSMTTPALTSWVSGEFLICAWMDGQDLIQAVPSGMSQRVAAGGNGYIALSVCDVSVGEGLTPQETATFATGIWGIASANAITPTIVDATVVTII